MSQSNDPHLLTSPLSLAGVPEQAGGVSSGSLRAHVELLEPRLQAPPRLRRHPLLSDRGRHEHGVEKDTEGRGETPRTFLRPCCRGGGGRGGGRREGGVRRSLAFIFVL